jgi:hypothetical protein
MFQPYFYAAVQKGGIWLMSASRHHSHQTLWFVWFFSLFNVEFYFSNDN